MNDKEYKVIGRILTFGLVCFFLMFRTYIKYQISHSDMVLASSFITIVTIGACFCLFRPVSNLDLIFIGIYIGTLTFLFYILDKAKPVKPVSIKEFVIDLPEEIQAVDSKDKMTVYFNKNRDTLFVAYRYHVCSDSTHVSCDGKCECDALGCDSRTNKK